MPEQKTCFVVMGFGKKTDFETSRVLDLDKSYRNMIKPAVEAAGLKCVRADEIVHSGLIDVPMYDQLLQADVVVADLSTSNKNAYYELGIRHALRPFTTIIIAEDGIKTFPFDIGHIVVRQYHHLGEDIGFDEVVRFRDLLTNAIREIVEKNPKDKGDSPVYTFIKNLTPPSLAKEVETVLKSAPRRMVKNSFTVGSSQSPDKSPAAGGANDMQAHSILMAQVDKAQKKSDWATAKTLLTTIRQIAIEETKRKVASSKMDAKMPPEDPYLLQRLALATYKSELPDKHTALMDARDLLLLLNPDTSNDMETLGLWGSVHKRLWALDKKPEYLDESIKAHERGFSMANDYYNGINVALLLNQRAAVATDADEAIADKVMANRVRKKVLDICNQWLKDYPMPNSRQASPEALHDYLKNWYWVKATIGEAYVGLGDEATAKLHLDEANAHAPEDWLKTSTAEQLDKLRGLLHTA